MTLEGEIGEIQLLERLVELWREGFTGAIRFESDGIIKIIYFKGGDVLSASTNDRADSIDEILMRANKVTREHVKQALAKRKESETLGDALLNLGFITRKELTWARRVQVVGVIRSIAAWKDGSFTIVADYLPKREEGTLFPLPQILVELIVTEQDRTRFERALDGGSATFVRTTDFHDVYRRLGLNEDADAITNEIDGQKSAVEVALASGKDTFNVYKLLHAMELLGILRRNDKPEVTPHVSVAAVEEDFSFETAGVADAADMWSTPAGQPDPPTFEIDDAGPTLEIPAMTPIDDTPAPIDDTPAPPVSVWDEAEETLTMAPEPEPVESAPAASMPAWDKPPRPAAVPMPVPVEPPADASEEQWGFDEAQIETARRASDSGIGPTTLGPSGDEDFARPRKKRSYGLVVALLLLAIVAGAAYFGFRWWQDDQATKAAALQPRPEPVRPAPAPVQTASVAPVVTTDTVATDTTSTTGTPTATTTAATTTTTSAPITVTAAPTPAPTPAPRPVPPAPTPTPAATSTSSALPVVTPAGDAASRQRYDAMARDFAASPSGNFTVQFAIFCQPRSVSNALRAGGDNVWFVRHGNSCYRVFWGHYETRAEAQQAIAGLPASLRDPATAVVRVPR